MESDGAETAGAKDSRYWVTDGRANQFDTVDLLLQELSAQQLRQRGARTRARKPRWAHFRSTLVRCGGTGRDAMPIVP